MNDSPTNTMVSDADLRVILRVARTGSLRATADELGLSQAALSKTLARVERGLGVPLFVRHGRGLRPTAASAALFETLIGAFGRIDTATETVSQGAPTKVVIATVQTIANYLLQELVSRWLARSPGVQLGLLALSAPQVVDAVVHGQADLGLVYDIAVATDEVRVTRLFDETLVGCVALDAAVPPRESLAEFCKRPLLLPPRDFAVRRIIEREFGAPLRPRVECNSLDLILLLVAQGQGVTLVPRELPTERLALQGLRKLPLDGARLTRQVVAVQHRSVAPGGVVTDLLQTLHGQASRLSTDET
jgi:LysR family transcriptional regulator, nitrogen assimilation regulatory protein